MITSLYRMYDDNDKLLYIGITCLLPARLQQHGKEKEWFNLVANVKVEHFSDRDLALVAETLAIQAEKPRYNRAGVEEWYEETREERIRRTVKPPENLNEEDLAAWYRWREAWLAGHMRKMRKRIPGLNGPDASQGIKNTKQAL